MNAHQHAREANRLLGIGQRFGRDSMQDRRDRIELAKVHALTSIAISLRSMDKPGTTLDTDLHDKGYDERVRKDEHGE